MDYLIHVLILALIYAVFAMGLNLQLGYAGLYNFGHVAFFGIGAYVSALLASRAGVPVSVSMGCAVASTAAAGALLAVPALRVSGDYFGIITLVFAEMFRLACLNERWLTKGPMGLPGIPRPAWIAPGVEGMPAFLLLAALSAAAVFLFVKALTGSPFGRALKVIREDEHIAQAFGKNVQHLKIKTIAAGSALAGLAGALWAHYISYISPADFTLTETILVLLCVVLGGRATNFGPVAGAFAVVGFGELVRFLPIPQEFHRYVAPLQGIVYGAVLVGLMMKMPDGILPEHRRPGSQGSGAPDGRRTV
jgi:ABC-type branched-subunit amino acid transport system permease subunit